MNIVKMDALEFVENIESLSIGMVLTDPPYGELSNSYKKRLHFQFERVCTGQIAIYGSPKKEMREFWVDGWEMMMPWIKLPSTKNPKYFPSERVEFVLFYRKVEMTKGLHWQQYDGVLTGNVDIKNHEHRKPPEDIARLIRLYTNPDDTILDCFAGSGVVRDVVLQMGRKFIGCDLHS